MQSPPTIVMCTMHNSMHLSTNDLLNISSSLVPSPLSLYADQPTTQTRISNFYVQTYSINHSWPTKFDMATADAYEHIRIELVDSSELLNQNSISSSRPFPAPHQHRQKRERVIFPNLARIETNVVFNQAPKVTSTSRKGTRIWPDHTTRI